MLQSQVLAGVGVVVQGAQIDGVDFALARQIDAALKSLRREAAREVDGVGNG